MRRHHQTSQPVKSHNQSHNNTALHHVSMTQAQTRQIASPPRGRPAIGAQTRIFKMIA